MAHGRRTLAFLTVMLNGSRCILRRWRGSDAPSVVAHANNPNIARWLRDRFPHPYSPSDARAFLAVAAGRDADDSNLAIDVTGEAVGGIGFSAGADVERYSAEIGYWLSEAYWGRGIATEALTMLTADLFTRHNLLRIFALPFADNPASVRVLEKAGYVREALLKSSAVKYGMPKDQVLYARINERWRGAGEDPIRYR